MPSWELPHLVHIDTKQDDATRSEVAKKVSERGTGHFSVSGNSVHPKFLQIATKNANWEVSKGLSFVTCPEN